MDIRCSRPSRLGTWGTLVLLLVQWGPLSRGTSTPNITAQLLRTVSELIQADSEKPFCFTWNLLNLVCFWESSRAENAMYTFYYQLDGDHNKSCDLRTVTGDTVWHVCDFPIIDIALFTLITVRVCEGHNTKVYERQFFMDHVVFLEPPTNVSVEERKKPWGVRVSWIPPYMELLDKEILYQINYSTAESGVQTAEVEAGKAEFLLTGLSAHTQYSLTVRARADGVSYKSYWSEWSLPVTIETSNDLDPLHLLLFILAGLIPVTAILILTLSHRRFLKHKVWPEVPTPDSHFHGLFTIHKGNFKLWLGQADSYLVWISRHLFHEDASSTLEVLSELPALPRSSPHLPPKDGYVDLDENLLPRAPGLGGGFLRWMEVTRGEDRPLEVPSGESCQGEAGRCENGQRDAPREESPLGEAPRVEVPRDDYLTSQEGKESPTSSFEYTILENVEGLLSPKPRPPPPRSALKYAYLPMSDSEGYILPPPPNLYQNSLNPHLPPPVYSQC